MTSFVLKVIAMVSMLIDHTGIAYFEQISWMNLIGRIAFPIFAFQISEGYIHTKNLKKYFLRLFLFALISQIPFMLFLSTYIDIEELIFTELLTLNIFFTLFVGLLAIFLHDKISHSNIEFTTNKKIDYILKQVIGIIIAILLGILAEICHFDYGFFGIAIIFMFYLFKNDKLAMVISYITACILKYGIQIILYGFNIWYVLLGIFTILPIIFICLYNGKQGKKVKYLLYLFYPVHLLILYFIFK